jgi:hypothetical protein
VSLNPSTAVNLSQYRSPNWLRIGPSQWKVKMLRRNQSSTRGTPAEKAMLVTERRRIGLRMRYSHVFIGVTVPKDLAKYEGIPDYMDVAPLCRLSLGASVVTEKDSMTIAPPSAYSTVVIQDTDTGFYARFSCGVVPLMRHPPRLAAGRGFVQVDERVADQSDCLIAASFGD